MFCILSYIFLIHNTLIQVHIYVYKNIFDELYLACKSKDRIHRCYVPLQFSLRALNNVTLTLCSRHVLFTRLVACKAFNLTSKACQNSLELVSNISLLIFSFHNMNLLIISLWGKNPYI